MSLAVESGMALNCCAFSVSSSTGVRGSVAVARQLRRWRKWKGQGRSLLALPLRRKLREKFVVFVNKF